jgi:hypothetical protein
MRRALTVSGVRLGFFCSINATAPETTGVAMLVPLKRKYAEAPAELDVVYCAGGITFPGYSASSVDPGASRETTRFPRATKSGFAVRSM